MAREISKVKKRDGRIVDFDENKISNAIWKAVKAVGGKDKSPIPHLTAKVIDMLKQQLKDGEIPDVEMIQDCVEKILIEEGHARVAKAYILYRQKRAEIRKEKSTILEKETIDEVDKQFDTNALRVLKARYLRKDESGKLVEWPKQLFTRVAVNVGLPDIIYDERIFDIDARQKIHNFEEFKINEYNSELKIGKYTLNKYHVEALKSLYDYMNEHGKMKVSWSKLCEMIKKGEFDVYEKSIDEFFDLMVSKRFMPNTPAIANFGASLGLGSACFVLDIEDSLDSIMTTLLKASKIFQAGGGLGYNFSKLRPEGDYVSTTGGKSSGPISFMTLFDKMTDVIKQGGMRRGANMGILNINHPDIEKFVKAKEGNKMLRNFNISVLVMPDFWEYYEKNKPYPLVNPRNKKVLKYINPRLLFDMIAYQAWESAEPGVIFFDHVNKHNPFYDYLGPIVTTNPCVASDSLISTTKGLERIDSIEADEIIVDKRVESNQLIFLGTEKCRPLRIIKTGLKDTFRLITKAGYELVATPDHKVMTDKGWKRLDEVTEEDCVLIQSGAGNFNEDTKLPKDVLSYVKNSKNSKLPTEWKEEIGLLLGWLVGGGFISKKHNTIGFVFSPEDYEAKRIIQPIFEKYCNRKIKPKYYENGCIQISSNSKEIVEFFVKLGYDTEQRQVPTSIFKAPKKVVIAFLSALFSSDSTLRMTSKNRNYIRLNSSSLKLLKQVQLLLLNLGIKSSICDRSTKPKVFFYKTKLGDIKTYKITGENYELNISKKNLSKFIELIEFLQDKNKQKINLIKNFESYEEYFIDRVVKIEYAGKREVWDITEPKTHSFIANGIVVHNCGEVLLYPNESCNLGSINVWRFIKRDENKEVDWESLKGTVKSAVRFLDNVIDINKYPLEEIREMTFSTRKIGLGIMGLADMLFELELAYNSEEGRKFMEKLMEFINYWSKIESIEIAKKRGKMPFFDKSFYKDGKLPFAAFYEKQNWNFDWDKLAEDIKKYGIRNGYTTVIAPTGSISMIAGCSSGIEPVFTLVYEKNVAIGSFFYVEPVFERAMTEEGLYDEALLKDIALNKGSIQGIKYIPPKMKKVFVTAMDIKPEDHIKALASFQKWVDSSISKTNNLPATATVEDVKKIYLLAYKLGCKDVTVYRDSSIQQQVYVAPSLGKTQLKDSDNGNSNGDLPSAKLITKCPECSSTLVHGEGCVTCPSCGWGLCK